MTSTESNPRVMGSVGVGSASGFTRNDEDFGEEQEEWSDLRAIWLIIEAFA